jgi:actin-related protein
MKLKKKGYNFNTTSEFEIVKKIKESLCFASLGPEFDYKILSDFNSSNYTLPDGNTISLAKERIEAPEILFRPNEAGLEFPCNFFKIFFKIIFNSFSFSFTGNYQQFYK